MSMLEQAILNAEELKEAAKRNAEQYVIDKFAPEVERAVEKLLEGSEIPHQVKYGHEDVINEIPGVADKIKEDTKEEENKEVLKVNFTSVVPDDQVIDEDDEMFTSLFENMTFEDDDIDDTEEESDVLANDEDSVEELNEEAQLLLDDDDEQGFSGDSEETTENEIHLSDDQVNTLKNDIKEAIKLNLTSLELDGWLGSTEQDKKEAHEMADAMDAVASENEKLKEELKEVKRKNQLLSKTLTELKDNVSVINKRFEEYSSKNGILYYSNKVLKSTTLSNKQKEHIVESIEKCASLNEAKLIYETLRNGVGSTKEKPKSLHEVRSKNEGIYAHAFKRDEDKTLNESMDPSTVQYMQKLAGIK